MPHVVVFALAVAEGVRPVVGAAPFDVLARQLPRLLTAQLNGAGDRGARYFPFVGPVAGKRAFLPLRELLPPEQLAAVHRQPDVQLLVDGLLGQQTLFVRLLDAERAAVVRELELPFDPRDPLAVLPRLEFEVGDRLGWDHRPKPVDAPSGEALGWWLIVKDTVLAAEAGLVDLQGDALRPGLRLMELAPESALAQDAVLDLAVQAARRSRTSASVCALLHVLTAHLDADPDRLERHAAIAQSVGLEDDAATSLARAARHAADRPELAERAAALLYRLERYTELAALIQALRVHGRASATALAQLAAVADRFGDRTTRDELTDELLACGNLPLPVARLVVSFLLEAERAAEARVVAERALAATPDHGMLQFELGRACLLLGDDAAAAAALRRALELGVAAVVQGQAKRLHRLAATPGLWAGSRAVEDALAAGQLAAALQAAHDLAKRVGRVPETLYLLGLVRHKLGQPRRAERLLRRAVVADESFADAHNRLGILLV
ncbi:MAG: hypothetical protein RL398_3166, partial [Planctomycetota bacterium]